MCGIVGLISSQPVSLKLLEGLKRLEYRGYDSAGIATIHDRSFVLRKSPGKLKNLAAVLGENPASGNIGIAHTRWATHGVPNEANAHPHMSDTVAVVHNGIIENHHSLRNELKENGFIFQSETDSEVITHLITAYYRAGASPLDAVHQTVQKLKGAYAIAVLFKDHDNILIGTRHGAPLAFGYGNHEMVLGSDALALAGFTNKISFLEEGDIVVLTQDQAHVYTKSLEQVTRPSVPNHISVQAIDKGSYNHFMEKEIFEQPNVIRHVLSHYLTPNKTNFQLRPLPFLWSEVPRITIVACGTAFYAGMVAKYWFEQYARIPVEIDIASEFRYRMPPLVKGGVCIFISQSGETADTLAAFQYAKNAGQTCLGIINVQESSLARQVDAIFQTYAGPEIGVASTKAFTAQLSVLAVLALAAAQEKNILSPEDMQMHINSLASLPLEIETFLAEASHTSHIKEIARSLSQYRDVLYLGRGTSYALALEGALKLKEISYIHAEGYAAGEIKHGPIALVDENVPVIMIAPEDDLYEKTYSNLHEVQSRGGKIILLGHSDQKQSSLKKIFHHIGMPLSSPLTSPLLYAIPIQLLAYYTAVAKGTDVDQPRNLAKSVTVE